ncbi:TIGR03960 family B12-binding radical SAM protein [Desulfoferrobacter suflitae]|uniref:TIGR03960 family B12-binding radical SAM protein n=1 Tax=Desulfoferrobacter suflitae TaxID=2865782 RepID=UPI002164B6E3|nr:TIGR03960 family B12-binding radical SAM protein [Desulfoferrobacter suflitae]MCK8602630.1 TIGR03960 family B12-binding radical SAM protein [Desulfoferrobacter suflitae]
MMQRLLHGIEKPGRYVGNEINACRKEFEQADVHFLLAFPDTYEVGLSHLGLRLLYHQLNAMQGVMADRVYAPWLDFEQRLRASGEPLRSIESKRIVNAFDFVGVSLQYELSYTNILTILDLGGIPLRSGERAAHHPWVTAGGPCAFNPEPLADFFDFIVLGEAEQVLPELIQAFREWNTSRHTASRHEFLTEIRKIPGIYVPSFFHIAYHPSGTIAGIEPLFSDYTRVEKRLVMDLDQASPIPESPLVPLLDIVHNRLGVEIARGCTRSCRFCQAGYLYRPVRERDPQQVLERTELALASSGFEELSLLSLSSGDYCQIQALLTALVERFAHEQVAVSLPSMRVGTLTPELMELVRRVRKTGFTLAPEAGSERLRRVINKDILDEDLLCTAQTAFRLGWRLMKLYFMTGLPSETEDDLEAMAALCRRVWELAKRSKAAINVSVATFVPKPQTPFQWVPQITRETVERRLESLQQRFKRPGLRLKWHHPGHSLLEAVFARGDRRLGEVLTRAWRLGARFDGWTEMLREDVWQCAFHDSGLDMAFYAQRERAGDEILPWDHLSAGVDKDYLWREYQKALNEEYTRDCRRHGCDGCGVCDHKEVKPRLYDSAEGQPIAIVRRNTVEPGNTDAHLYQLQYARLGDARFFGQLEVAQAFARAVRRAALPAAYSLGFHPHMKLSFGQALPLGLESLIEEAYLSLTRERDCRAIATLLNVHLPEGITVARVQKVAQRSPAEVAHKVTYRVSDLLPWAVRIILQNLPRLGQETLSKRTKKRMVTAQLSEILLDLRPVDESSLEMDLHEAPGLCFRPTMILERLLGESTDIASGCRICKVRAIPFAGLEENEDVHRAHHQC